MTHNAQGLSPKEKSKINMENLGKEYLESAQELEKQAARLRAMLTAVPLRERTRLEARIELLLKEARECRRLGAEAAAFYLPGHRYLPRYNGSASYKGTYLA